jgi:hypothetical protein
MYLRIVKQEVCDETINHDLDDCAHERDGINAS